MSGTIIIKNGTIVTSTSQYQADIKLQNEKIVEIAMEIDDSDATVIDATGKYVLPGAVDVHTHLELPFNGTTSADDYKDGTIAAVYGGTTTIANYLNQKKDIDLIEMMEKEMESSSKKAVVDYTFHFGITHFDEDTKLQMREAVKRGITSFKVYTTYRQDNMMMEEADFCKLLAYSKEIQALLCVHAENNAMIEYNRKHLIEEGKTTPWFHYVSRDEAVEAQADQMVIFWAKKMNAPLYIVHLGNKEGYEEVKKAKSEGYPILAETCPQYLEFTCDVYKREDAMKFVCSPPMKNEESRQAIWKGVKDGTIDVLATDHCPFTMKQKELGKDDFTKIPNGCMGVENRYPYMLSKAMEGELPITKVVELCCEKPARLFGFDSKGAIEVGKDADIVIYNPVGKEMITQEQMHTATDYTIWEGITVTGKIETTILRGTVIVDSDGFHGTPGNGKFIARSKSSMYQS